ncbi:MAG: hypothetical protein OXI35_16105, partial [Gemmatimonadota bacterium]|nr:hypothetical protein [Gemmatimonadota bacterium]
MQSQPTPFLDWYGIWPSHRKLEDDGTVWSQDPPQGIELAPELARKSEVFFRKERPWEQGANLHINAMLHDEGRYRLWYGVQRLDDITRSYVCYAESDDGFTYQRPELGLCEYEGSTRNNIICAGRDHPLGWVFIDPSAPAAERYKAVGPGANYFRDGKPDPEMDSARFKALLAARDLGDVSAGEKAQGIEIRQQLLGATSPDGIHWHNLSAPVFDAGATQLDTHNLCVYDPHQEQYVAYLRGHIDRRRLVRRASGPQFESLADPHPCLLPDPLDALDDDIYNPCYTPYPGTQPRYLMFPSIYHRIASTVDVQLAVSRDNHQWIRPFRQPIIDRAYEGGTYGQLYASPNLIAANDTWRLPFGGYQRRHDFLRRGASYPEDGEFRWACWEPDRLAGIEAKGEGRVTL